MQVAAGNVSMLLSVSRPPVMMRPAMGNTDNNGGFALKFWMPQSAKTEESFEKVPNSPFPPPQWANLGHHVVKLDQCKYLYSYFNCNVEPPLPGGSGYFSNCRVVWIIHR